MTRPYHIQSPGAMAACVSAAILTTAALVVPMFDHEMSRHNVLQISTAVGLTTLTISVAVLGHLWTRGLTAWALTALAFAGSLAIVWETSNQRAQTQTATYAASDDTIKTKQRLELRRREAEEILAGHRRAQAIECASGRGKKCDGMSYTVQTWEAAVSGYEAKLRGLPVATPNVKIEQAATLARLLGYDEVTQGRVREWVALIDPRIVPVLLELISIVCGICSIGARPVSPVSQVSQVSAISDFSDFSRGNQLEKSEKSHVFSTIATNDDDTIIVGLQRLGGIARSQRDLAKAMGICDSEVSKRLANCAAVERVREDNRIVVRLKDK